MSIRTIEKRSIHLARIALIISAIFTSPLISAQSTRLNLSIPESFNSSRFETHAENFTIDSIWIAGKVGQNIISSYDVIKHIEYSILTERQKISLFKEANSNFDKYQRLIKKRALDNDARLFNFALAQIMRTQILQNDAFRYIREQNFTARNNRPNAVTRFLTSGNNSNETKAKTTFRFQTTVRQFNEAVSNNESRFLQKSLDQGLGIVRAREIFGQELKNQGFPHRFSESASEVYWRWYKSAEKRIKFELLENEIARWERYKATKRDQDLFLRPGSSFDFYRDLKSKIERELHGQKMNAEQLEQYLTQNSEVLLVLQDAQAIGPQTMSMKRLSQIATETNHHFYNFEDLKNELVYDFKNRSQGLTNEVLRYEQTGKVLFQRHGSSKRLRELARKYDLSTNDSDLMLSRLYAIAEITKEVKNSEKRLIQEILENEIEDIKKEILDNLKDNSNLDFTQSELKFYQYIAQQFRISRQDVMARYANQLTPEGELYLSRILYMAEFLIRTTAKNSTTQQEFSVSARICNYQDYDCFKNIDEYLKSQKFQSNLKNYYENRLYREMSYLVEIQLPTRQRLNGVEAINFALEQ